MANRVNGSEYSTIDVAETPKMGWQKEMLTALQNTATPEPIRLACMKSQPNRPALFGEEFHGRITREEVEELLRGSKGLVNGRYLVRESLSSPGDYSLSLSYADKIEHYRLYCDNNAYSTSRDSGEKSFESLTDLVIDILDMLRVVKYVDGQACSEKKDRSNSRPQKPHNFKEHSYKHPKWCDLCANFMWGLKAQGMKCEECGMNVHRSCMLKVRGECKSRVAATEKEKPRKKSGTASPKDVSFTPDLFKVQCEYQEGCAQFISNLNVPASYFDPSALNPCYCDYCCQDVDTPLCKSGDPARYYSLPIGWCRFKLSSKETDHVKSSWNMAFLSVNPNQVQEVLESRLNQQETETQSQEGPKPLTKLTPSIICADLDAVKLKYTNHETGESRAGQLLLQAYIQPYSYKVMGRAGSAEGIDPYFKNDVIYWVTNQMLSIVPFALLVKTMDATYLDL